MTLPTQPPRILVLGENATDVFVYGDCRRLSPEAPVPVHSPRRSTSNPGMAANVKANILSLCPDAHVDFFHQTKSIMKVRHVDEASGQHLLRVDDGDDSFTPMFWERIIAEMAAREKESPYRALVISDYHKGLLSTELIANLTTVMHEIGVPVFMDTKKVLGCWSSEVDYIKINDREMKAQFAAGVKEPWKMCRNLIVTHGREGAALHAQDGSVAYRAFTEPVEVASVAGAGDSFMAALVVKYLVGGDIKRAMDYANKAARVAVSKPGVVAVKWEEVE